MTFLYANRLKLCMRIDFNVGNSNCRRNDFDICESTKVVSSKRAWCMQIDLYANRLVCKTTDIRSDTWSSNRLTGLITAKLQNTQPLQPLHLNKNGNYCYIPRGRVFWSCSFMDSKESLFTIHANTIHLTWQMTFAQVVKTSVTKNSSFQNYPHQTIRATDTPGFKPLTIIQFLLKWCSVCSNSESSRIVLECALLCDCSAKKTVKF